MYLVDFQFLRPLDEVDRFVSAHREHLSRYYADGSLLLGGRKIPRTGGIILSRQASLNDVQAVFDSDPMVAAGVARYSIVEFQPVMMRNGLEDLI